MSHPERYGEDPPHACPFCGRHDPGQAVIPFEDWWAATECQHICCFDCSDWQAGYPLCPSCAKGEVQRNGKSPEVENRLDS